jgi:hypothetical protein
VPNATFGSVKGPPVRTSLPLAFMSNVRLERPLPVFAAP